MSDNSAPGIYTQPDGDADDVLGHRAAFRAADGADFRAADRAADRVQLADEDDVEGHRAADRAADRAL